MILSILLSLIFIVLAIIHFNWVLGGAFGFDASLPTNANGKRVLNPSKIDSAIVGLGLTVFACFYIYKLGFIKYQLPNWISIFGSWIIPAIFLLRAIGDFKYIGFFKRIHATKFSKLDTNFFSPLCLIISVVGIVIQLYY